MFACMVFSVKNYDKFLEENNGKYIACMFNLTMRDYLSLGSGVYMIASDNLEEVKNKIKENKYNLSNFFIANPDGYTIDSNTGSI